MKQTTAAITKPAVWLSGLFVGTIALAMCLQSVRAGSQEHMARVDVSSGMAEPIDFDVVAVSEGASEGSPNVREGRKYYEIHFPATGEWREGSITIKPAKSGRINFTLLGPYILTDPDTRELKPLLVEFDDVQADTAVIKNGGFEKSLPNGSLAYWEPGEISTGKPPVDDSNRAAVQSGDAPEGSHFIRVWHNSRFNQGTFVEENVPLTLTFKYRLAE